MDNGVRTGGGTETSRGAVTLSAVSRSSKLQPAVAVTPTVSEGLSGATFGIATAVESEVVCPTPNVRLAPFDRLKTRGVFWGAWSMDAVMK